MPRYVPPPQGWHDLNNHLVDQHGIDADTVDATDADQARRLHDVMHRATGDDGFEVDRVHYHDADR